MGNRSAPLVMMLALGASSCGTVTLMMDRDAGWRYPGAGIVNDLSMILDGIAGTELARGGGDLMGMGVSPSLLGGLVSLPLDAVIDAILIPFSIADGIVRLTWTGPRYR